MIRLIALVLLAAFVAGCRPAPRETDACLAGREALSQILEMNADRRITMLTAVTIDSRVESLTSQLEAKAGDSDPRFTFGWKKVGADGFQPADVLPTPDLAQSFLDTAPVSLTTCDGVRADAESARVVFAEPSKAGSLPEGLYYPRSWRRSLSCHRTVGRLSSTSANALARSTAQAICCSCARMAQSGVRSVRPFSGSPD